MNKPTVSIIIPTYNEEENLITCLQSIRRQDFPQQKIEILIVDDGSTDATLYVAKQFKARIFKSGFKHIERSKSIGIEHAKGEYLFFMDADILLVDRNIISMSVQTLEKHIEAVGAQCFYWKYSRRHTVVNRYCELFGVNDPFPYYLLRRGIRSYLDHGWIYPKTLLKDTAKYYLVRFTSDNLPTLGSQGYLCRTSLIKKYASWKPYFFHLDTTKQLVDKGFNTFVILKLTVEHDYAVSVRDFYNKLYRNLSLFYKYRSKRTYDYGIRSFHFYLALFKMMTIVYPLTDSVKGYLILPDIAWFLHPLFCVTVPILYALVTIKFLFNKLFF
jgi:glycosyltransferase involved in cell wall biosynthesis